MTEVQGAVAMSYVDRSNKDKWEFTKKKIDLAGEVYLNRNKLKLAGEVYLNRKRNLNKWG
jgi:hypothetical protein